MTGLRYILASIVFIVAVSSTTDAPSQATPTQSVPALKPANLKVLPKEMTTEQVLKLMHRYQLELGVPCTYCHAQDPDTKVLNYASDENPVKQTARIMIGMTSDINSKYLSQLGDRRYAEPLSCGNCHQGHPNPPDFEPK